MLCSHFHLGLGCSAPTPSGDKIMSAEFEWNLIVLLQRQGKDCISMKWAIDLSDESLEPRWVCHTAQSL